MRLRCRKTISGSRFASKPCEYLSNTNEPPRNTNRNTREIPSSFAITKKIEIAAVRYSVCLSAPLRLRHRDQDAGQAVANDAGLAAQVLLDLSGPRRRKLRPHPPSRSRPSVPDTGRCR